MSDANRRPYLDLHAADLSRYRLESHAADVAAAELVEARQQAARTVKEGESRGARAQADQDRLVREDRRLRLQQASAADDSEEAQLRREAAAQKKADGKERRDRREAEEQALAKQHRKLDKDEARKASARLEYLLKQSSIFAKLQGGKGGLPGADDKDEKKKPAREAGAHHIHRPDSTVEDDEVEEEEETERHVFLTKQPSTIKFGQLKPYQLEALNWMIHLAEKGLNGILADGTYRGGSTNAFFLPVLTCAADVIVPFSDRDGSGQNLAVNIDSGLPLGVSPYSGPAFDLCSQVDALQLDERTQALVSVATSCQISRQ